MYLFSYKGYWQVTGQPVDEFRTVFSIGIKIGFAHKVHTVCSQAFRQVCRLLLADAETAEYDAQQVVGGKFTGYFTQCLLGQPKFFGK